MPTRPTGTTFNGQISEMNTFIFDIGKTNVKVYVLDDWGNTVWQQATPNTSEAFQGYLAFDAGHLWDWLQEQLIAANRDVGFCAINISAHGACAALVDDTGELCLPIMDYEDPNPNELADHYQRVRPPFQQTLSPKLDAGLNLGAQLFWLKEAFPADFERCHWVLMYPQYWAFKLTGIPCTEVTSLGCHTDLWRPRESTYSSLVPELGLDEKMPPLVPATSPLGSLNHSLADRLGLPVDCSVYPGVHDSNSSLARHLWSNVVKPFNVISTGTWVITMAVGQAINTLTEETDTLANVDVTGVLTGCARFMGGREFAQIAERYPAASECWSVAEHIEHLVMVIPPVDMKSGPFAGRAGGVRVVMGADGESVKNPEKLNGEVLATLHLALMIDYELSLLKATGAVLFGSSSNKNPLLCQLIAQLRPEFPVLLSNDETGTVKGAWCLTRWDEVDGNDGQGYECAVASDFDGLERYLARWRELISGVAGDGQDH